jgi:hypothetical protein
VRVPPTEYRCSACEVPEPLRCGVDQRGDDPQIEVRHDERRHHQKHSDGDRRRFSTTDLHDGLPYRPVV